MATPLSIWRLSPKGKRLSNAGKRLFAQRRTRTLFDAQLTLRKPPPRLRRLGLPGWPAGSDRLAKAPLVFRAIVVVKACVARAPREELFLSPPSFSQAFSAQCLTAPWPRRATAPDPRLPRRSTWFFLSPSRAKFSIARHRAQWRLFAVAWPRG